MRDDILPDFYQMKFVKAEKIPGSQAGGDREGLGSPVTFPYSTSGEGIKDYQAAVIRLTVIWL